MRIHPRMRPYFDIPVTGDGLAVLARLKDLLAEPGAPFIGDVLTRHGYLRLPHDQRTMLSPNLDLELMTDGLAPGAEAVAGPHLQLVVARREIAVADLPRLRALDPVVVAAGQKAI